MTEPYRPTDIPPLSRRDFLKSAAATAALAAAGCSALPAQAAIPPAVAPHDLPPLPQDAFRVVHMTDVHLMPQRQAAEGLHRCIAAIHELSPRPDFIYAGGDMVHNALAGERDYTEKVFDLYNSVVKDCEIPIRYGIGNHDIFGWASKGALAPDAAGYGKQMFKQKLDLDETQYHFEHKGWTFFVIDDVHRGEENPYVGRFDDATMDWLDRGLGQLEGRPAALLTHIPVFSLACLYWRPSAGETLPVPGNLVCLNVAQILRLLEKHRVPLVMTGHIHQNEVLHYQHTTHLGCGAVCGNWWQGANLGSEEGFNVVDFASDGSFTHHYVDMNWTPEA